MFGEITPMLPTFSMLLTGPWNTDETLGRWNADSNQQYYLHSLQGDGIANNPKLMLM